VPIPSSSPTLRQRGDTARLDAVVLEPLVSRYLLDGHDHASAVLGSASLAPEDATVALPGIGTARIYACGATRHLMTQESSRWLVANEVFWGRQNGGVIRPQNRV
jgi:hypothetical protein